MSNRPEVVLYRMVLPDHICPYGLLAKRMLEDAGLAFEDRLLTSRAEVDAFKARQGVATTPQIFIDGERIGGTEELSQFLKKVEAES